MAMTKPTSDQINFQNSVALPQSLTVDGTTLVVDGSTNRVGIGTASPTTNIHAVASNPTFLIENTSTAGGSGSSVTFGHNQVGSTTPLAKISSYLQDGSAANRAGDLLFHTTSASILNERMRIVNGGDVIIGNVNAAGNTTRNLDIYNYATGASAASSLRLITHNTTGAPSALGQLVKYQTGGFVIENTDTNAAAHMAFLLGSSERMRILSSGQVCIGRTSLLTNTCRFNISYAGGGAEYGIGLRPAANATTAIAFENAAGTQIGSISQSATNTAFNTSSDYRLKFDVSSMSGALDRVAILNPCTYKWIEDGSVGEGFIAHELQAVIPMAVTGTKDAVDENGNIKPQGVDYSRVVPTLTAAIKELKAIVESQAARIAALEARA